MTYQTDPSHKPYTGASPTSTQTIFKRPGTGRGWPILGGFDLAVAFMAYIPQTSSDPGYRMGVLTVPGWWRQMRGTSGRAMNRHISGSGKQVSAFRDRQSWSKMEMLWHRED